MCDKCKDTGFVPYYRKDGTLVPGIRVHCECYEEPRDTYVPYSEDMIDFLVSWPWHRHYQSYYGQPDPGPLEPRETNHTAPVNDGYLKRNRSTFRALNQRIKALEKGQYAKQELRQKRNPSQQGYTGLKEGE